MIEAADEVRLRRVVREVWIYRRGRWLTRPQVHVEVRDIVPGCSQGMVDAALRWNEDQGWLQRRLNADLSTPAAPVHEWRISDEGWEKITADA